MRASSPSDLRRINREASRHGVNGDVADLLVTNTAYSPRQQTALVAALDGMAAGRSACVRALAAAANDPNMAYFRQRQAQMYANYHSKVTPIERFVPLGQVVAARTKAGTLLVAAPVDYLIWTPSIAALAEGASDDARASRASRAKNFLGRGQAEPARPQVVGRSRLDSARGRRFAAAGRCAAVRIQA
jgi:hypothetical protein